MTVQGTSMTFSPSYRKAEENPVVTAISLILLLQTGISYTGKSTLTPVQVKGSRLSLWLH